MKRYYSLLARVTRHDPWGVQFGDYDRSVVEQEQEDMGDEFCQYRIVATMPNQLAIDQAVKALNDKEAQDRADKALRQNRQQYPDYLQHVKQYPDFVQNLQQYPN